jgi:GntR family transcriptional regulator
MAKVVVPSGLIDRASSTPVYRQLAAAVRGRIADETYPAGSALPSERTMMADYGLSRVAVRLAIDVLARDGLIVRRRGKGTYVARPRVRHDLTRTSAVTGFYDALMKLGGEPAVELRTYHAAVPSDYGDDFLPHEAIVFAERVFRAGREPIVVSHSDLHPRAKTVSRQLAQANLNYELLTELLGFTIERADLTIRAELPSPAVAATLCIAAGEPVLVLRRATFAVGNIPIERTAFYIRSDRYEFALAVQAGEAIGQTLRPQPAPVRRAKKKMPVKKSRTPAA